MNRIPQQGQNAERPNGDIDQMILLNVEIAVLQDREGLIIGQAQQIEVNDHLRVIGLEGTDFKWIIRFKITWGQS